MDYKGKLFGNIGGKKYFDTGKTADDFDDLEKQVKQLQAENKALKEKIYFDTHTAAVSYVQRQYVNDSKGLPALLLGDVCELIKLTTGQVTDLDTLEKYRKTNG